MSPKPNPQNTLRRRLEFERAISEISRNFVGLFDFDDALNRSLGQLGRLAKAGRIYLFQFDWSANTMSNTHEWCCEGVTPELERLQALPIDTFPWWMDRLQARETIHIPDVSQLGQAAAAEREILEAQDIKSVLVLPVLTRGKLMGFIGFDNVENPQSWGDEDLEILEIFAHLLGNAMELTEYRNQTAATIERKDHDLRSTVQDLEQELIQRKKVEKELLLAKERAESADRAKTRFLASISHELRTPLNSLIGFSEVLLDERLGSLKPEQRDAVGIILENAHQLLALIEQILEVTQVAAGKGSIHRVEFSLRDLFEKVSETFREEAVEHEIDWSTEIAQDLDKIIGDRHHIERILHYLIQNAFKFTPDGNQVTVTARVASGSDRAKPGDVIISIRDTGIGVAPEHLVRLFRPFEQIDNGSTPVVSGTGLGLYSSKSLVELCGGSIWVDSVPTEGTTFHFSVPQGELNNS